jgi:hypothetical protein
MSYLQAPSIYCAVIFLSVISIACAQECGQWPSCSSCTVEGGCGWCGASNTCEAGNSTSSFAGCSNDSYVWLQRNCSITPGAPSSQAPQVSTCSNATNCSLCTALAGCGWCSDMNECQNGNATSSFEGCALPYWSWTTYQCSAAPRSMCNFDNGYCHSCVAMNNCGYCKRTGICEEGGVGGSAAGDCSGGGWVWGENSTCHSYGDARIRRL